MKLSTKYLLLLAFFFSGFSGLIYESIWSHYLKLFLGHAAYAQTLVLVIYMGGMAIGAWLASKLTKTKKINFLLSYALLEGVIGVFALVFHTAFVNVAAISFGTIIPTIDQPFLINSFKWTVGALLIMPQSILLGATFPLMSNGLLRRAPDDPGKNIALLYFVNSLGASIGVLASGFLLIKLYGLPGTLFTAGIINIVLACCVWLIVRGTSTKQDTEVATFSTSVSDKSTTNIGMLLLIVSGMTGMASFVYEIVWIRMLSLVLGTSNHAFELMLSAFIFGIALGGLFIRKKIDSLKSPIKTLAFIQLAMGVLAASTTLFYNSCFELMAFFYSALQKNNEGYFLFNIYSHFLAILVMLPTTFCAGMTLPLITKILIDRKMGERTVGLVYASNTVGAIVGIAITVHLLQPLLGLKNTLLIGALIDILLGIILYTKASGTNQSYFHKFSPGLISLTTLLLIFIFSSFNPTYTASGVYRHGVINQEFNSVYHKDGKTATVDVIEIDGVLSIKTNGKPDAAISMIGEATPDEPTMRLAAWIPISIHANATDVAIIGMGSGLTTESILASPKIQQVDTIEIEPAMVEGAKRFGARVQKVFLDSRSHIYIEDAKTFFTSQNKKYDLIISEPSNPWVTGVAGLFSAEFYQHTKKHLKQDGLFVQWVQIYEMNDNLVGSIIKAISNNFYDYKLFYLGNSDLLIVAKADGDVGNLSNILFTMPEIYDDLDRIDIRSLVDIETRFVGNKIFFGPYLEMLPTPENSDFFPVLDQNADKSRFKNTESRGFISKDYLFNLLGYREIKNTDKLSDKKNIIYNPASISYIRAWRLHQRILNKGQYHQLNEDGILLYDFEKIYTTCNPGPAWLQSSLQIAQITTPYLPSNYSAEIWKKASLHPCFKKQPYAIQAWINTLRAFSEKNYTATLSYIENIYLTDKAFFSRIKNNSFFIQIMFISHIQLEQYQHVDKLWNQLSIQQKQNPDLQFLYTTAVLKQK